MARLIFTTGKFAGRVYEFAVPKTTVGRGDQNTLTIHDSSVSHAHCEIHAYDQDVIVRDLGSSNGTFVNGERLFNQQRPLAHGQTVKFGSVEARLEVDGTSRSSDETDVTAVHSHARHLREPKKIPAPETVTLDASPASDTTDHTVVLTRHPDKGTASPPSFEKQRAAGKKSDDRSVTFLVALIAFVLAVILWLVWGRG